MATPVNYRFLMDVLSVPRPNGSAAERETRRQLRNWLEGRGIDTQVHEFDLYPYLFEVIGIWIILSRGVLVTAILLDWGWWTLLIGLIGLAGGLVDFVFRKPLISWIGKTRGQNLFVRFEPEAGPATKELILSAHTDTKTEPLDHQQRMLLLRSLPLGITLSFLLSFAGPLQRMLPAYSEIISIAAIVLAIPTLVLAFALGFNLSVGRLLQPSRGALDNGTACAILLGLAQRIKDGSLALGQTRVTIAWFTGEEADRQGSWAFAGDRQEDLPAAVVNLEVMAQDGEYVLWDEDGTVFKRRPTDPAMNGLLAEAVENITGQAPIRGGPMVSDGAAFIAHGLPTAVLGTYDTFHVDTGFHCPDDCLDRVVFARLPEGVDILTHLIEGYDRAEDRLTGLGA
jgi:hypothetical protein